MFADRLVGGYFENGRKMVEVVEIADNGDLLAVDAGDPVGAETVTRLKADELARGTWRRVGEAKRAS